MKLYENIDFDDISEEEYDNSIPYDFIDNEDFYRFIVDNNIYDEFIKNYNSAYLDRYSSNHLKNLKDYLYNTDKYNFIEFAFNWDENGYYWYHYHILWIKNLRKIIKL